jgi:hypothetical protein
MISGIIALLGAVFVVAPLAEAATTPAPAAGSTGQGLEISPPVIEVSANPGETVTVNIRVRNVTKGELIAKGKADDFGAGSDEDGQPKLLLDETGATRFSLKYWIQSVPDLRLAPQELKTNVVKISVPSNAEPGGHFGVIRFTAVPPNLEGTGVALSASVGSLVLLKVAGKITEKTSLAEFSALRNGKASTFFEYGPIDFLVRVRNEGSVHEKVQGTIDVKSWTGKKVGTVIVNEKGGNVLPDSVRRFNQTLNTKQLFGHYSATLALTYSDGKKLDSKIGFWVIPWKMLLLGLIGLMALVFVLRLAIRRYNEHIIAMARRR